MNTLVIATYNGSEYIVKQLESIKNQSKPLDRVIIIDDASTDNTASLVKEFIDFHNLLTWELYISKINQGHFKSFFSGLSKITQLSDKDYVFLSDQDDIWKENKVEQLSNILGKDRNIVLAFGQSDFIDHTDRTIREGSNSNKLIYPKYLEICIKWPSGYQMALRGDILKEILDNKFYEMKGFYFHDVFLALFYGLFGKIAILDKVLDMHRLHFNNVTKRIKRNKIEEKSKVLNHLDICIERFSSILEFYQSRNSEKYLRQNKEIEESLNSLINFLNIRKKLLISKNPLYIFKLTLKFNLYERKKLFLRDIFYTYFYKE